MQVAADAKANALRDTSGESELDSLRIEFESLEMKYTDLSKTSNAEKIFLKEEIRRLRDGITEDAADRERKHRWEIQEMTKNFEAEVSNKLNVCTSSLKK